MREVTLEARTRKDAGKGVARKLRAAGKIPAVVYGKGEEPMAIELEHEEFHNAMRGGSGENLLINLSVDGVAAGKKALIREMQRDPVDGSLLHIDFIHDSIHIKDFQLENVEILENPERTVASIVPPTVIKEEAVVAEGEEAEVAEGEAAPAAAEEGEPEVIAEKKAEERQAEKGKPEKGKGEKEKGEEKKK
jgi:ribosomal protein L25 (general stress protein Ctc)